MSNSQTLIAEQVKDLSRLVIEAEARLSEIAETQRLANREKATLLHALAQTRKKLEALNRVGTEKPMNIAQHAVIRFIERKKGLDPDHYRQELYTLLNEAGVPAQAAVVGSGKFVHGDYTFVVKDNVLITVF